MRRALVVCTANVCRSPTVERLLQLRLDGMVDADGESWVIRSAGTSAGRWTVESNTMKAAAAQGADLSEHTPRLLDADILSTDGADLVIAMERAHLPAVTAIDPGAWPRTFTLKEIVRRAAAVDATGVGFVAWRRLLADGRRAADMMRPDPIDDVADPYGGPRREHDTMVNEVSSLVDRLAQHGPWEIV